MKRKRRKGRSHGITEYSTEVIRVVETVFGWMHSDIQCLCVVSGSCKRGMSCMKLDESEVVRGIDEDKAVHKGDEIVHKLDKVLLERSRSQDYACG